MAVLRTDFTREGLAALLPDLEAMGIWEYLRRLGKPTTAVELAGLVPVPLPAVQSKLDGLVAAGLAEAVPASARRRSITYRSIVDALVVECDWEQDGATMARIAENMRLHIAEAQGESALAKSAPVPGEWRAFFGCTMHLSPDELAELRRRFNAVVEYTELLAARYTSPAKEPPPLSNYAATFRVAPVAKPCLPHPRIVFVKKGSANAADHRDPAIEAGPKLSRREWDVALALTRGLTQAEAGAELGISPLTAVTLTKRIYKKLGVRRRAELVSRLQSLGAPPAAE
jgi:DNA-binding CsgD family transcriptional regulator